GEREGRRKRGKEVMIAGAQPGSWPRCPALILKHKSDFDSGGGREETGAPLRLFAKAIFQTFHFRRPYRPFREQAKRRPTRSYGLRPESKADLYITISSALE
ncbi:hypothetical protein, partial [Pseudomonas syringae]|uniref:hypothetical protein n=1 Tax=Pseudomonas syringae TaxID=317 RepID=UPI0019D6C75E